MTHGSRSMARAAAILGGLVAVSLVVAPVALAAAPGNDAVENATLVASLPFTDGPYDTTEATTAASDPGFCFDAGSPDAASVWYSFTPTVSGPYQADTFGSDYDTTLSVGAVIGTSQVEAVACNDDLGGLQSAAAWDAEAGITYLILVGTCCGGGVVGEAGGGGTLAFHLDVTDPLSPARAIHDHIDEYRADDYDTEVCGFTVLLHLVGSITQVGINGPSGLIQLGTQANFRLIYENPANGESIVFRQAGATRSTSTDFSFSGLHDLWVMESQGALIVRAFRVYADADSLTVKGVERFTLPEAEMDALFCSLLAGDA